MSNSLAIAALTGGLCDFIEQGLQSLFPGEPELSDCEVSCMPPDVARTSDDKNQLNLFLFQTSLNAAWRNQVTQPQTGGAVTAPLPLNLYYLLTAYGRNNDDMLAHAFLGRAMRLLHDYPLLHPDLFTRGARNRQKPFSAHNLNLQIERLHVAPLPLSMDELSKLWGMFQVKYRLSIAYQVQVVLIDSEQRAPTPLPVLSRGELERGDFVRLGTAATWTALQRAVVAENRPSARFGVASSLWPDALSQRTGDTLTLQGSGLDGAQLEVELLGTYTQGKLAAVNPQRSATTVSFTLPEEHVRWPAGPYSVRVRVPGPLVRQEPDGSLSRQPGVDFLSTPPVYSNVVPVQIAPRVLSATFVPPTEVLGGQIAVRCSPQVWPGQRVSLLCGDRELPATPLGDAKTDTLVFAFPSAGLSAGSYYIRLRVDGVDSLLLTSYLPPPEGRPALDLSQRVVVP